MFCWHEVLLVPAPFRSHSSFQFSFYAQYRVMKWTEQLTMLCDHGNITGILQHKFATRWHHFQFRCKTIMAWVWPEVIAAVKCTGIGYKSESSRVPSTYTQQLETMAIEHVLLGNYSETFNWCMEFQWKFHSFCNEKNFIKFSHVLNLWNLKFI
jgi:hypothetical protein